MNQSPPRPHERARSGLRRLHRRLVAPLWPWLLPTRCAGCRRPLGPRQRAGACAACWSTLRPVPGPSCPRCALPLVSDVPGVHGRCPLPSVDGTLAAVRYDGTARALLLAAKLGGRRELLGPMGAMLARVAERAASPADRIVPVPSHPWTVLGRGFSPARELAEALARVAGVRCMPGTLGRRLGSVPRVVGLDPARRRRAVRRAFAVRRSGRAPLGHVLLVDDVVTTGATASACATALRSAGASTVTVAAWARTLPARPVRGADHAVVSPHRFV